MTDEEKYSCDTCEHQDQCDLKHRMHDAMVPSAAWRMLTGSLCERNVWTDMLGALAEVCSQYVKMKETEQNE